jgi:dTDP-glucose 4,6-dehydratase
MSKRILLTGVGGFIGAHVLQYILDVTDWEVVGIERWNAQYRGRGSRLKAALEGLSQEQRSRLTLVDWDLNWSFDYPIVAKLFEKPVDTIISMASDSAVTKSVTDPRSCWENNCKLAINMLELARQNPTLNMFVQVSTDEVYGDAGWDSPGHHEWDTIVPSNPYSASKAAQEALAISYWRTYDVPVVITNTMNVVGEWQDPEKFLPLAIKRISCGEPMTLFAEPDGKTTSRRVWLDVKNMAAALVHICSKTQPTLCREPQARPDRYHIVGNQELSVEELAQKVADCLGKPLLKNIVHGQKIRPGYDRRYALVDNNLKATGFVAPVSSFEFTIHRIIQWARSNTDWVFD